MEVTLKSSDILRGLKIVAGVVPTRTTIPLLGCIKLECAREQSQPGMMTLFGTSIDQEALARVPAVVIRPGAVAIPAATLQGAISGLPHDGEIKIAVDEKTGIANISSGRSRYSLRGIDAGDVPVMTPEAEGSVATATVNAVDLAIALEAVVEACEIKNYRGLAGVRLHKTKAGVYSAVATDGLRLIRHSLPASCQLQGLPAVTIPSDAAQTIIKLLKTFGGEARLSVGAVSMMVSAGDVEYKTRLQNQKYPGYERLIPELGEPSMRISRAAFRDAVDRALVVGAGAETPEKAAPTVRLVLAKSGLSLSAGRRDRNAYAEDIEAEVLSAATIVCSLTLLSGMLAHWDDDSVIEVHIASPEAPILFTSASNSQLLDLIMPVTKGDISYDDRTNASEYRAGDGAASA